MSAREWPANDYAIGSYIQASVSEQHLPSLSIKPTDHVLDIGCGNGAFTRKILDRVPNGSVLGIDASQNMLELASEVSKDYPNFSLEKADVVSMQFQDRFDYIVSFFCLQWASNIHKAFENILRALKPGGKILTLFPSGDDPYIMGYYALKQSGRFESLENFVSPVDYSQFDSLSRSLKDIPFGSLKIALCEESVPVPSLEAYRKFVNGIAFYQGQVPEGEIKLINEAMVDYFVEECQRKHHGEYRFDFTSYLVTGVR